VYQSPVIRFKLRYCNANHLELRTPTLHPRQGNADGMPKRGPGRGSSSMTPAKRPRARVSLQLGQPVGVALRR